MEKLKSFGNSLLGIVFMIVILFLIVFFLKGAILIAPKVNLVLVRITSIGTLLGLLVFIPLAFFRKTRIASAVYFQIASFFFGLSTWVYGFLATYIFAGTFWLVLGLITGVGVIPIGLITLMINGEWGIFGNLIYAIILTLGSRFLSTWLFVKIEKKLEVKEAREDLFTFNENNDELESFVSEDKIYQSKELTIEVLKETNKEDEII